MAGLIGKSKGDKKLRELPKAAARKLMVQVDARVVLSTPRDTGRAANNWVPSVARASDRVVVNRQDADAIFDKSAVGDSLYLTNNVPYITRLNEGHSKQAPVGFVQLTLRIIF